MVVDQLPVLVVDPLLDDVVADGGTAVRGGRRPPDVATLVVPVVYLRRTGLRRFVCRNVVSEGLRNWSCGGDRGGSHKMTKWTTKPIGQKFM